MFNAFICGLALMTSGVQAPVGVASGHTAKACCCSSCTCAACTCACCGGAGCSCGCFHKG